MKMNILQIKEEHVYNGIGRLPLPTIITCHFTQIVILLIVQYLLENVGTLPLFLNGCVRSNFTWSSTRCLLYTRALILWHPKIVSHFSQPISIKFHIEIDNDTFQFLNCVIVYKNLKFISQLCCKLTYNFVVIDFWCFLLNNFSP